MSKRLGGIIGCKDKTSTWHLIHSHFLTKNLNASRPSEHPPVRGNNDSYCFAYPRPAFSAIKRTNHVPISFDQQAQVFQGHTSYRKIREIGIPRSMVVEVLS